MLSRLNNRDVDMKKKMHSAAGKQRGVIMVFFAILLPLLFGFMGFAFDLSVLYVQRGKTQDIADAAALGAAAHLKETYNVENRNDKIRDLIGAYINANGLNVDMTKESLQRSNGGWDEQPSLNNGQNVIVEYGIVVVDFHERVRVRINRRVPTFFLNVLFNDFKNGLTVVVLAAAEGESEGEKVTNPDDSPSSGSDSGSSGGSTIRITPGKLRLVE